MSQCRDCGAPVIWAKTQKGSNILLDAEPLEPGKGKFVLYGEIAQFAPEDGEHTCHWDTSPECKPGGKPKEAPTVKCPKCGHPFVGRAR